MVVYVCLKHLNYCHLLILMNKVVENENLDNSPGLHSNLPIRGCLCLFLLTTQHLPTCSPFTSINPKIPAGSKTLLATLGVSNFANGVDVSFSIGWVLAYLHNLHFNSLQLQLTPLTLWQRCPSFSQDRLHWHTAQSLTAVPHLDKMQEESLLFTMGLNTLGAPP